MSRSSFLRRRTVLAVALAAAVLGAAVTATAPAHASAETAPSHRISGRTLAAATLATARAAAGGTESVQLRLTPRDRSDLRALAQARGAETPARQSRLQDDLAGPERAAAVAARLRGLGLTVTASDDTEVSATGPAATVNRLFGTAQDTRLATAQALPAVPAALGGLVTVAYGGDDTRPAELPLGSSGARAAASTAASPSDGTISIAQARSLYGTAASTAPPSATSPIVATLQFTSTAIVDQAITDTNTFAAANHLYGTSTYRPSTGMAVVSVPGCSTAASPDDGVEVALDQQTLLSVAPQARQRIYTSRNCGAGQDDALDQVVRDVAAGQPILALSTSWGACENAAYAGDADQETADEDAVDGVLASGVTMFAAAGDSGAFDCRDSDGDSIAEDAVDSPASLSGVVAVGGTQLETGQDSVTAQTAWNDGDGATGGGYSCGFTASPAYQSGVAASATYPDNGLGCPVGGSERSVPDISADAGDGLDVVFTDDSSNGCPAADAYTCTAPIVGTSFASPLAAGGLAETLLGSGAHHGLGDIHGLLYQQAGSTGFTDVTTGGNGDYDATTGYDPVTGLGTPDWRQLLGNLNSLSAIGESSGGYATIQSANLPAYAGSPTPVITTPLQLGDEADQWDLFTAPYGKDQANDLWAVHLDGTTSGRLEVHVLSQASGYQTYLAHIATALGVVSPATWSVRIASYAGDRANDLFLVGGVAGSHVQVHVLSAASSYQKYLTNRASALHYGPGWTYLIGDGAGSGDLVAVHDSGTTGSGRTEVHILSRTSGYATFSLHEATPLALQPDDGSAQWSLRNVAGTADPDLELLDLDGSSGHVERSTVIGPGFGTLGTHLVTALPQEPSTDSVGLPE